MTNTDVAIAPETSAAALSYSDLIKEAFVDPIRTVTVIDDEYPTLNGYLNNSLIQELPTEERPSKPALLAKQTKKENIIRLQSIIKMCQNQHKWSVDVYDGKTPTFGTDESLPEHLNHSDLIILDYHLDGEPATDNGERARKIIGHLSENNHFNQVVVHTKGHDGDIKGVFKDILKDLLKIEFKLENFADINNKIETWLEDEEIEESSFPILNLTLDTLELIKLTQNNKDILKYEESHHLLNRYQDQIIDISDGAKTPPLEVVSWLISKMLKRVPMLQEGNPTLKWDFTENINFISTGRAFITVLKKANDESVELIYSQLNKALIEHNPPPIMLLMAKMRYELDENGVEQANDIINDHYAQSGWLIDMLNSDEQDEYKHFGAINRHWEQLSGASKEPLITFSKKMYSAIKSQGEEPKVAAAKFFPDCELNDLQLIKHLNAYNCSFPINTSHITTGTILELENKGISELWLCLTPACDLVPSQAKKRWLGRLGNEHSAFQAVQLFPEAECTTPNQVKKFKSAINQNEHIFIKYENDIKVLRFTKDAKSNPVWETFQALDHGKLSDHNTLQIQHLRVTELVSEGEEPKMILSLTEPKTMKAIVELRYEYALNFLQKFGANQSRVGLGYISDLKLS
jgi:hypothetical protein